MNATLKRLQRLLNSPQPPKVITLDSWHVPLMKVVEGGTQQVVMLDDANFRL